jgi:hypothetical protein
MRNSMLKTALCFALAGCAATGVKVTDAHVAAFKPGEATEAQVTQSLGQPTMRMRMPDGTVMLVYSYAEASVRPATFIPIIGGLVGGSDSRSTSMTLRFGADGKLIDTTSSSATFGTGMGPSAGKVGGTSSEQPRQ